jgi:chemotaxis protein MotB
MMQAGSDAADPINRRISILVLSQQKEKQIMQEDVLLRDTLVSPAPQAASGKGTPEPAAKRAPEEIK